MHKKNIFTPLITQIVGIGTGIRIACSMLTASIRSGYTLGALFCLNAIFLLHYFDVIIRTIFGGGSFISWAIINIFKRRGITINLDIFGIRWLLHLPEYITIFFLFALLNLMMVHIVINILDGKKCGVGRSLFRALRSWRAIFMYAFFMSGMVLFVGDVYLNGIRFLLAKLYDVPVLMDIMYEPVYGKKMMQFLIIESPYWLSNMARLAISMIWYLGTFLLFPIIAIERCSFFKACIVQCV